MLKHGCKSRGVKKIILQVIPFEETKSTIGLRLEPSYIRCISCVTVTNHEEFDAPQRLGEDTLKRRAKCTDVIFTARGNQDEARVLILQKKAICLLIQT